MIVFNAEENDIELYVAFIKGFLVAAEVDMTA
jgi:hypothetical protein